MSKNYNLQPQDDWSTPLAFWETVNDRYDFDYDPCPIDWKESGAPSALTVPWGKSNWCNPPYSRGLKSAFVEKAVAEAALGNQTLMLLPVSTSTVVFHQHIVDRPIQFLRGRLKFEGVNSQGQWVNPETGIGRHPANNFEWVEADKVIACGQHDSMLVLFEAV